MLSVLNLHTTTVATQSALHHTIHLHIWLHPSAPHFDAGFTPSTHVIESESRPTNLLPVWY